MGHLGLTVFGQDAAGLDVKWKHLFENAPMPQLGLLLAILGVNVRIDQAVS